MRGILVLVSIACASCASFTYGSTDGERSTGSWLFVGGDAATHTIERSARNDIPCDEVHVLDDVRKGNDGGVYVVEGCGQRLAYTFLPENDDLHTKRCTLISRLTLQSR